MGGATVSETHSLDLGTAVDMQKEVGLGTYSRIVDGECLHALQQVSGFICALKTSKNKKKHNIHRADAVGHVWQTVECSQLRSSYRPTVNCFSAFVPLLSVQPAEL